MRRRVGVLVGAGVAIALGAWFHEASQARRHTDTTATAPAELEPRPAASTTAGRPGQARPGFRGSDVPDEHLARIASPVGAAADAASDVLDAVRAAIAASPSPSSSEVLMRALDSDDPVAKLEAIDELARRKHIAAIGPLMKIDPSDDPFVGPTALLALGQLAHEAGDARTEEAVARLEKLLEAEKERRGTDSPGNILLIVEALGLTKVASAARILERELVGPEHGTAAKVAIVDAIEACGQRSSVRALAAYRATFQVGATGDFERQLELELIAAIGRAVETLDR